MNGFDGGEALSDDDSPGDNRSSSEDSSSSRDSDVGNDSSESGSYYSSSDGDDVPYDSEDLGLGAMVGELKDSLVGVVRRRVRNASVDTDHLRGLMDRGRIIDSRFEREDEDSSRGKRCHHHHSPRCRWGEFARFGSLLIRAAEHQCPTFCTNRKAGALLLVSMFLWILAQTSCGPAKKRLHDPDYLLHLGSIRRIEADSALGSAAEKYKRKNAMKRNEKSGREPDKLPSGCSYPKTGWQTRAFPNCNELHEIDFRQGINPRRKVIDPSSLGAIADGDKSMAYVGSGLWRDVWEVDPRGELGRQGDYGATNSNQIMESDDENTPVAVLKVMKREHAYDFRNYDRHRRDALVMERLSSSPYIVEIYGYCANSVLTEYVGQTLDDLIYEDDNVRDGKEKINEYEGAPGVPNHTNEDKGNGTMALPSRKASRETSINRIRLALDIYRGIADLHNISGSPVLHADVQAKQFLIDPRTGTVKLNDFNRCRFLPRKGGQEDGSVCRVKIPSAPGANRAPEEYNHLGLSEKVDVFSAAHIVFGILTGKRFWANNPRREIKKAIMAGQKPTIPQEFIVNPFDNALADLMFMAYEQNVERRISSKDMVFELERLLEMANDESSSL